MKTSRLLLIGFTMMFLGFALLLKSCTGNQMAKRFGGSTTVELEPGKRLVNITWKEEDDLWILTKTDTTIKPTTYSFKQKTGLGFRSGEVIIVEK